MAIKDRLRKSQTEIVAKYNSGMTTRELGKEYDCNCNYISDIVKETGVILRNTSLTKERIEDIVRLYKEDDMSARAIDRLLGLKKSAAENALKKRGIDISCRSNKRDDPLEDDAEDIIIRYNGWEGASAIAKDYDCSAESIYYLLRKCGVPIRSHSDYSYSSNESFFDVINSPTVAYCLGFYYGDGCNQAHRNLVRLSIADLDILERIQEELQFEGPLYTIPPKKEHHKIQYAMHICSRHMCEALTRVGCVSSKTYLLKFPTEEQVPSCLHRHLIRGWMDADGCICYYSGDRFTKWSMSIVGTESGCKGISESVNRHLGFKASVLPHHIGEFHTTWNFMVGGKYQVKAILDWIYDGSTIHLERKFNKYRLFSSLYPNVQ